LLVVIFKVTVYNLNRREKGYRRGFVYKSTHFAPFMRGFKNLGKPRKTRAL
jgi:hypothetical protein